MRSRFAPKKTLIAIAAAGALALAGCGGSGGGSSSTMSAATTQTSAAKKSAQAKSKPKQTGGKSQSAKATAPSGSAAKGKAGKKASVAQENATIVRTYGTAGSSAERDQAAQVAALFLSARAAGNWTQACANLASWLRSQLEPYAQTTAGSPTQRCAAVLGGYEAKVPQATRQSQADVHALALRVKGDEALLIYRDGAGKTFDIPMRREGGEWKTGAIAPGALAR
jgi:hypothetical protein